MLDVRDLEVQLFTPTGVITPVSGISFKLESGQAMGVVGESGSGKTTLALSLLRLIPETQGKITSGQVLLDGRDLLLLPESELRRVRGKQIAMILQDPMTSLNPTFTVGFQLKESIRLHQNIRDRTQLSSVAVSLLRQVKIPSAESRLRSYPHQLSGGMRQRVVGAIGLASNPSILIADEPTTSLDVTTQAGYLALIEDIRQRYGTSLLLITHDLGVVAQMCGLVAVMYAGKIVEMGTVNDLFDRPSHPYTRALLASRPGIGSPDKIVSIRGHPPSMDALPPGCSFQPRCEYATQRCNTEYPPLFPIDVHGHVSACWNLP